MSDNDSSSLLGEIIAYVLFLTLFYLTILVIPIIPYLDMILSFILSIHKPDSILGNIFLGAVVYVIGYFLLESVKFIAQKFFANKGAMYLFLYGQGLMLIGFLGEKTTLPISSVIVSLISAGFNEPIEVGKYFLIIPGVISLILSYFFEHNKY